MPRPKAERLAESLWPHLKPLLAGVLDLALAEQDDPQLGPDGADSGDAEERYIAERAAAQVARHRGKVARPRKATQ